MLGQLARMVIVICIMAALAMGFGWLFCWWSGLGGEAMKDVLLIYAAATGMALTLFLGGHVFRITSQAYYIVIGGAIFLAVDLLVWQHTGIMPAAKFVRGGFLPAAIIGFVLGIIYRVVAVPTPALPHRPDA